MNIKFEVPGKTFLLGEYLVLHQGRCLGVSTQPSFEIEFTSSTTASTFSHPFHPQSPAGRYFQKYKQDFQNLKIEFRDTYGGRGGYGASTAQYLGLWGFRNRSSFEKENLKTLSPEALGEILREYRELAWLGVGAQPSGADLALQIHGGCGVFNLQDFRFEALDWPWPQADFFLISTGHKVSTHDHLKNLKDFPSENLKLIFEEALSAWKSQEFSVWTEQVQAYGKELEQLGFVAPESLELQKTLRGWPGVRAVKGCGALGADVIFSLVDQERSTEIEGLLRKRNLQFFRRKQDLSLGLRMTASKNHEKKNDKSGSSLSAF